MFGNNMKVHFAGCDGDSQSIACETAGVKYALYTAFPHVWRAMKNGKFGNFEKKMDTKRCFKHTIMDSGLFTLMFGRKAGHYDKAFMEKWLEYLCEFAKVNGLNSTCVEVDCQKVLGVEEAWAFRKKMRELLPNRTIINVFHQEDGQKGLDRLIEFADYIAISVPEMRIVWKGRGNYEEVVIRLANYIKGRKPSIDIHLLGCTVEKILKACRFCTSSDSTSWNSFSQYHHNRVDGKDRRIAQLTEEAKEMLTAELRPFADKYSRTITKGMFQFYVGAKYCLRDYTNWAGDQS